MDLKISEVAELLHVSESTVTRWVKEGHLCSYRLNDQLLFAKDEVESWILSGKMTKGDMEGFSLGSEGGWQTFSLYRSLHRGGIIEIEATTKEEAIFEVTLKMEEKLSIDPQAVGEMLIEREHLMSTAVGNGVAIPHSRDCLLHGPYDVVIIALPKHPIDWSALDGKEVNLLFFLFACDDKRHLNLLAKIAHLASHPLINLIKEHPSQQDLLNEIKQFEHQLSSMQTV